MKKKRRRARLSFGTVFMLLLTLLAVLGCAWFLMTITGGEMTLHASELIEAFNFAKEEPPKADTATITAMPLLPAHTLEPAPAATASPNPTATPVPEKTTITLAAAGTVYAPKAIRQTVETENGEADFDPVLAPLAGVLGAADLTIATLETTTAGSEKGYGNYNAPPQILDALRDCGVDLVSLGTERALDKGYEGLAITMQEITSRGISYAGAYADGQSGAAMMRIGGVQVAVLAYSYGLSSEGREKTDGDSQGQLPLMQLERMRSDITAARMQGANVVVVLPHWGTKNKQTTPETVRTMAQELAKAGADVILGTHPNVVQGMERISAVRPDGLTYETLVCYSLGSLLTDARTAENTAGLAVTISITYDPVTRRVSLGDAEATPLYIARTKAADQTVYRVVPAENEEALLLLDEAERTAARNAAQLVRDAIGGEEQP